MDADSLLATGTGTITINALVTGAVSLDQVSTDDEVAGTGTASFTVNAIGAITFGDTLNIDGVVDIDTTSTIAINAAISTNIGVAQ